MAKKILFVDDEADLCELAKITLEKSGQYTVITASDSTVVEGLCLREKPDLIILDVVMPDMEGPELVEKLRKNSQTQHIKIIVSSGGGEMVYSQEDRHWHWEPETKLVENRQEYIDEKSPEKAAAAYGVDGFLSKPYIPRFLLQIVDEMLNE